MFLSFFLLRTFSFDSRHQVSLFLPRTRTVPFCFSLELVELERDAHTHAGELVGEVPEHVGQRDRLAGRRVGTDPAHELSRRIGPATAHGVARRAAALLRVH